MGLHTFSRVAKIEKDQIWIPGKAYINKSLTVNLSKPRRIFFGGLSGSGKTFAAGTILNQSENVIYFDPQSRFKETLIQQNELKNWRYLRFSADLNKDTFRMNVRDLDSRIMSIFSYRKDFTSSKTREVLNKFLRRHKENKTYSELAKVLKESKLDYLLDALDVIIHPEDKGIPIEEIQKGKWAIDISQLNPQDIVIGTLTQSIIGYRVKESRDNSDGEKIFEHKPLMIAIDECQEWAKNDTATGSAFGEIAARGRIYNISSSFIGASQSNINTIAKAQLQIFFLFQSTYEIDKMKQAYGLDIWPGVMEGLPTYHCIYYNIEDGVVTPRRKGIKFDLYYQKFLRKKVREIAPTNADYIGRIRKPF